MRRLVKMRPQISGYSCDTPQDFAAGPHLAVKEILERAHLLDLHVLGGT